jgi:O-antigen/teichoic acid export membrane protein
MTGVLWLLAPDLLVVVFGQTYLESTPIFRVYLLMLPIRIVYFSIIYQAYGKSMLILGRSLLALFLNVILSVPLALWIGPIGAALSTVIISWGIMVPFNARSVSKMTGFSIRQLFLWSKLGGVVLSSLLTVAVAWGVSEFLPASAPVRLLVLGSGSLILILLCHALFRVWGWQQQKQFAEAAVQKLLYILKRK